MDYEFIGIIITIVFQGLYIAFKMGVFEEKLDTLEKKQDRHNSIIERVFHLEENVKSAHKRIDEMRKI